MVEKTMKAVAVTEPGNAKVIEVTTPTPQAGEVLIRIDCCLLCTWEQRIFRTGDGMKLPFIPGHELAGTIAAIPEDTVTSFQVGDRVVAKTLDSCGHCEFCYRGDDNNCIGTPKKRFYDGIPASGGLAQYISLPVSRVYRRVIDRASGKEVAKELVLDNQSRVMYDPALIPPDQIRQDTAEEGAV